MRDWIWIERTNTTIEATTHGAGVTVTVKRRDLKVEVEMTAREARRLAYTLLAKAEENDEWADEGAAR